jgi:hypothetical protein
MHNDMPAYGLWALVVLNSAVFIIFAFSFTRSSSFFRLTSPACSA